MSKLVVADIAQLVKELPVEAAFGTYQVADLKPIEVLIIAVCNNSDEMNMRLLNRITEMVDNPFSMRVVPYEEFYNYCEWHYSK